ncbi:secretory phospholipase A2 receptor [Rhincodon typus]|uniref:secretory phospholipase A2 receptor n=1 Tax=Rhincodon typus TaxID=259920 RepID=UPI0020300C99|nr:secretory phospholipase A2 receptor [Rhincodon typus]
MARLLQWMLLWSCYIGAASEETYTAASVLNKNELLRLLGNNIFILQSEHLNKCITVKNQVLILDDCSQPSSNMLWKWVSKHRLFHLSSSMCLGLNISAKQPPLKLFNCGSIIPILWWHCSGKVLTSASQYKLTVGQGQSIIAERTVYDRWKRYMTQDEGPCEHPYEEIHTVLGNSRGRPCALPFKYNNKLYHECTNEGRDDKLFWCATTDHYDVDETWGFCPNLDPGCDLLWEKDPFSPNCYQYNLQALHSWNEARASCQAQGGDLLSIRDLKEQEYIVKHLRHVGILAWIGLNQLDEGAGWQWSDGEPLSFVIWDTVLLCPHRFEQAFINSLISNFAREDHENFWIGLQDRNQTEKYTWLMANDKNAPVSFTNWNKNQPGHSGGCVALVRGKSHILWEVKDCKTFKAMSLCEQKVTSAPQPKSFPDQGMKAKAKCHFGWESSPDLLNCFKVFHHEKVLKKRTWEEAEQFCQAFGAHLASFSHYSEEVFLNEILGWMFAREEERWFWIGFNKRNPSSAGSWSWSDGSGVVSLFSLDKDKDDDVRICAAYKFDKTIAPFRCDEKLGWVCKMSKGAELKKPDWYIDEEQFAFAPWIFFQGAEYLFFETEGKWLAAAVACSLMGSDLASINTAKEQDFVKNRIEKLLTNGHEKWWIGLYAENSKAGFRWIDDSGMYYNNWDDNYPSRLPKHSGRCVYVSSKTGRWGDSKCFLSLPFICERHNISLIEVHKVESYLPDLSCPKGWLYFENKCFLLYAPKDKSQLKHWYSAQMFCSIRGGTLATIENEIEQAFLTIQLLDRSTSVWIGLHSDNFERWVNGKPVKYSNWLPNEPTRGTADPYKNDPTSEHLNSPILQEESKRCALLSNSHAYHSTGRWYTRTCNTNHYGFVCQKYPDKSIHHINASSLYPILDTFAYGNYTYKLIKKNVTWYEALNECRQRGTELVSITDQYHQAFLTVVVNRLSHPHWIGLSSPDDGKSFIWSDGSSNIFSHWAEEDPHSSQDCGYMDINGYWKTANCETQLPGAFCQVLQTATSSSPAYKVKCPNASKELPWIPFRGNCYLFDLVLYNSSSLTMEKAKEVCGNLATKSFILHVKDEEENNFVFEQIRTYSHIVDEIWLGITFDIIDNAVKWLDGTPVTYSNWGTEEPAANNFTVGLCAAMRSSDGAWFMTDCGERLGAVCQTDLSGRTYIPKLQGYEIGNGTVLKIVIALVVTVIIVLGTIGFWYLWKRNQPSFRFSGNAYYRQTTPEGTDCDGNILIAAFERNGGN